MLCLRFGTQRRQPRRRQVCARRDALSSWHEVRRPMPHRPGPSTHACDCWPGAQRLRLHPPLPLAAAGTGAPQARLDPPPRTAFAPQARLDPPPRTPLRRRLVSILHAGGERARRGLLPSARTAGCVVAFVIAELRAPRADRARAAGGATPHPSQFCSREPPPPPLVCPLRGAPLGLAAPPPPCTLAHASASASADRLSWATSRLQLGANLAADRTGRVFGVVSPVRVPCAVCRATR